MANIMNGELGIMTHCDRCGKELFRKAERGGFIMDHGDMYQRIYKYEDLPDGWAMIGTDLLCPDCKKQALYGIPEQKTKTLWARLGATLELTPYQYDDIMNAKNDPDTALYAFKAAIDAGCFKIDGNCYIPCEDGAGDIAEFDI